MSITRINSLGITDGTIVNGDINDSAAIASTKLSGVNDAKAWVNFNGTGTVAIRASFNVSSITDNGTGDYTVNFTTALTDANYAVNVTAKEFNTTASSSVFGNLARQTVANTYATSSIRVVAQAGSEALVDVVVMNVSVFR